MAPRRKNLNANNDAEIDRLLQDLNVARADLLAVEQATPDKNGNSQAIVDGANRSREASILTAQQIASIDLSGVDWAVLSACNTGNSELLDGEGVLGLQRAFRVAGVRTVIMTLWPADDQVTGRFMHELYSERFALKASTADAVWRSARKLLLERRAAGKSTHPWYWAGFVGSGGWE